MMLRHLDADAHATDKWPQQAIIVQNTCSCAHFHLGNSLPVGAHAPMPNREEEFGASRGGPRTSSQCKVHGRGTRSAAGVPPSPACSLPRGGCCCRCWAMCARSPASHPSRRQQRRAWPGARQWRTGGWAAPRGSCSSGPAKRSGQACVYL